MREVTNSDRARWALEAVRGFQEACATGNEDALGDLLCDLMHLADRWGDYGFEHILANARRMYQAESLEDRPGDWRRKRIYVRMKKGASL